MGNKGVPFSYFMTMWYYVYAHVQVASRKTKIVHLSLKYVTPSNIDGFKVAVAFGDAIIELFTSPLAQVSHPS